MTKAATMSGFTPQPQEAAQQPQKRALVNDPELLAINRISKTLNALGPVARRRVVDYLTAKYGDWSNEDHTGPAAP